MMPAGRDNAFGLAAQSIAITVSPSRAEAGETPVSDEASEGDFATFERPLKRAF